MFDNVINWEGLGFASRDVSCASMFLLRRSC